MVRLLDDKAAPLTTRAYRQWERVRPDPPACLALRARNASPRTTSARNALRQCMWQHLPGGRVVGRNR